MKRKIVLPLLMLMPAAVFAQSADAPDRDGIHHVDKDGIPIANPVVEDEHARSKKDTLQCIHAGETLLRHEEELMALIIPCPADRESIVSKN